MPKASRPFVLLLASALAFACAAADPAVPTYDETGGSAGIGGGAGSTGATAGLGGSAGANVSGGAGVPATGGAGGSGGSPITAGSGGAVAGSGGAVAGTGGAIAGTGGAIGGSGGDGVAGLAGMPASGAGGGAGFGQGGSSGAAGSASGAGGSSGGGAMGGASGQGTGGGAGAVGGAGAGAGTGGMGAAGTGGAAGSGSCTMPSPPQEMVETINLTWQEMTGGFQGRTGARPTSASVMNFRNLILDQLFAAGGSLNFCVRWESTATVSATVRDQIATALDRGVNEWFSKLVGHNCFPYARIPVKVVGWATRDRNLLGWSGDTPPVYVNDIREDAPQCAEACGRFFHQQAGYTYPQCAGGAANHYDMSLWLTQGMNGGAGGDWGQRVGSEYYVNSVTSEHQHIWLHEFGHGLGFPDYYEWDTWAPGVASPNSVMVAGRAALVTDWDTWMIRHLWNNMRSRFQ